MGLAASEVLAAPSKLGQSLIGWHAHQPHVPHSWQVLAALAKAGQSQYAPSEAMRRHATDEGVAAAMAAISSAEGRAPSQPERRPTARITQVTFINAARM